MSINSLDALVVVLVAILPGFVSQLVYRAVLPTRTPSGQEQVFISLAFGTINFAIHSWWLVSIVFDAQEAVGTWAADHPVRAAIGSFVYLLLTPATIGYLPALTRKHFRIPGILAPHPTAWDHFFSKSPGCLVYAVLKDGTRGAGLYDEAGSGYASAFPNPQSVYLPSVFPLNDEGAIIGPPVEHSKGVIIRADDCILLEFMDVPTIDEKSLWSEHDGPEEANQ